MLEVTEKAAKKALQLAAKEPTKIGAYPILRVGVRGGGCSGLSYYHDFTKGPPEPNDHVWQVCGLTIVCDPKSMVFLEGCQLDYDDKNLLKSGFKFNNPQAKRSCSCGESFSIKGNKNRPITTPINQRTPSNGV